jgi:hypothetical protein
MGRVALPPSPLSLTPHLPLSRQVCLSRPRAAFARVLPSPVSRLGHSLLAQALEQLHCLPPASLRFSYMHPMDDGQQRCFKVRFEGEGADDYGGPYRECFAQIVQEVCGHPQPPCPALHLPCAAPALRCTCPALHLPCVAPSLLCPAHRCLRAFAPHGLRVRVYLSPATSHAG